MAARADTVEKLVLDRSFADFSSTGNSGDLNAQTAMVDCLGMEFVDVIVEFTNLGSGPLTQVNVVGRASAKAEPDVQQNVDWATINTEELDTATGIGTIRTYIGSQGVAAVGRYIVTFPVRARYFSALVWVDVEAGSRGNVFVVRR
jgi:hypothetical protein